MSYNLTPQIQKSRSFSKYLYANIDQTEDFYIFDIKLLSYKKKSKKIKKIKNSKSDTLIDLVDNININKYFKLLLTIINIHNPTINHSLEINLSNKPLVYKDDFIYLELTTEMNLLKCFYNLEVN